MGRTGWILEVDLEYPREVHEENDRFPLAPEKKIVKKEWMSDYQRRIRNDLDMNPLDTRHEKLDLLHI